MYQFSVIPVYDLKTFGKGWDYQITFEDSDPDRAFNMAKSFVLCAYKQETFPEPTVPDYDIVSKFGVASF
jgi:hypothetical protein